MSKFVVEAGNDEGLFCFFEDDGDTGYFYFYEPDGVGIIDHLHICDYPKKIGIRKKDVEVIWSNDYQKCGVKIWDKMFGIFDFASNNKIRHYIRNRETAPITDPSLLEGF